MHSICTYLYSAQPLHKNVQIAAKSNGKNKFQWQPITYWELQLLATSQHTKNDNYNNGEEDNGKEETPEKHATILHCVFRDFCHPPPLIR